jgi:hypothetical protein
MNDKQREKILLTDEELLTESDYTRHERWFRDMLMRIAKAQARKMLFLFDNEKAIEIDPGECGCAECRMERYQDVIERLREELEAN